MFVNHFFKEIIYSLSFLLFLNRSNLVAFTTGLSNKIVKMKLNTEEIKVIPIDIKTKSENLKNIR